MSNLFQSLRPWLELAYFAGGVILAAAGLYGLRQVRLMKQDMEMRSERAAREKAIEYVSRYFSQFVPLDGAFTEELKQHKLPVYRGPVNDFNREGLPASYTDTARKRFGLDSWLPALNELHTVAAAFAYGVADDQLGFQAIGRTFCNTVESTYDILCIARSDSVCQHYEGIVQLYRRWSPRMAKSELTAVRAQLDQQISTLDGQVNDREA